MVYFLLFCIVFKIFKILIYVYMHVSKSVSVYMSICFFIRVCVCVCLHICRCLWMPKEGVRSSVTGVKGSVGAGTECLSSARAATALNH